MLFEYYNKTMSESTHTDPKKKKKVTKVTAATTRSIEEDQIIRGDFRIKLEFNQ